MAEVTRLAIQSENFPAMFGNYLVVLSDILHFFGLLCLSVCQSVCLYCTYVRMCASWRFEVLRPFMCMGFELHLFVCGSEVVSMFAGALTKRGGVSVDDYQRGHSYSKQIFKN